MQTQVSISNVPPLKHDKHFGLSGHKHLFGQILITGSLAQSNSSARHSSGSAIFDVQLKSH